MTSPRSMNSRPRIILKACLLTCQIPEAVDSLIVHVGYSGFLYKLDSESVFHKGNNMQQNESNPGRVLCPNHGSVKQGWERQPST